MNFVALSAIFVFAALSLFLLLHVKTDVQSLYSERQQLVKEQSSLKELIKVQKAELAYNLNPARLEGVAKEMGLQPLALNQLIPVKPEAFIGAGGER